jgi:hypothetical protein
VTKQCIGHTNIAFHQETNVIIYKPSFCFVKQIFVLQTNIGSGVTSSKQNQMNV